jgi:signal transduction histidine kinase
VARQGSRSSSRALTAFVVLGLAVLLVVAAVAVVLSEVIARRSALDEAAGTTSRFSRLTVAPLLPGALAGVEADWESLDRLIEVRLRDGSLRSVVVWDREGTVVYSTDESLVGTRPGTGEEFARALAGETVADVDDDPETGQGAAGGRPLVEVYTPLTAPGADLVLEAYYSYAGVEAQTRLLREQIVLVSVGGMLLLQLVQIPIAASMARRIRREEQARIDLADRVLAESDRERRTIAADLHDGPVQELAGIAYTLGALRMTGGDLRPEVLDQLDASVVGTLAELRRLMVEAHPPDADVEGLRQAVLALATEPDAPGVSVVVEVGELPDLPPATAAVVLRAARELLANAQRHARARRVDVRLAAVGDEVHLVVEDDGVGLPAEGVDRRADGHLGLRLVVERARDAGGRTVLGERPGGGASVLVALPLTTG